MIINENIGSLPCVLTRVWYFRCKRCLYLHEYISDGCEDFAILRLQLKSHGSLKYITCLFIEVKSGPWFKHDLHNVKIVSYFYTCMCGIHNLCNLAYKFQQIFLEETGIFTAWLLVIALYEHEIQTIRCAINLLIARPIYFDQFNVYVNS